MKSFLECLKENNIITITELYQYENEILGQRIDESLWSWLKNLWNKVFKTADKNLKVNKGEYIIPKSLSNDIEDGIININSITVADMPESNFLKFIKKTNSENPKGQFYNAYQYYKNHLNNSKNSKSFLDKAKQKLGSKGELLTKPYILMVSTKKDKKDKEASLVVGFYFLKIEKEKESLVAYPMKYIPINSIQKPSEGFISIVNKLTSKLLENKRKNVKFIDKEYDEN
ncbi:MAG: hypothetical protein J1F35_03395 [Erysipelotrichales bacterium]|nr:hypothetical protein [Erysipelotrichales bacterium]